MTEFAIIFLEIFFTLIHGKITLSVNNLQWANELYYLVEQLFIVMITSNNINNKVNYLLNISVLYHIAFTTVL